MAIDQHGESLKRLAAKLREARESKRLSQRALSDKIGLPQSHISKIESGKVDLKASSLIEIARALGLEVVLVPQSALPAAEALSRLSQPAPERTASSGAPATLSAQETYLTLEKVAKDSERASRALAHAPELARLAEVARALRRLRLTESAAEQIRRALRGLEIPKDLAKQVAAAESGIGFVLSVPANAEMLRAARTSADTLTRIRNMLAHGAAAPAPRALPAYRLDDEDDDD